MPTQDRILWLLKARLSSRSWAFLWAHSLQVSKYLQSKIRYESVKFMYIYLYYQPYWSIVLTNFSTICSYWLWTMRKRLWLLSRKNDPFHIRHQQWYYIKTGYSITVHWSTGNRHKITTETEILVRVHLL
jgi:hypothetical protein